jgi:hypothetical protein
LLVSLDCTHTFWKNCPTKAWQGSYKGKEAQPLIVLEAVADYGLSLWHALYGYTGTLNDTTILSLCPLMSRVTEGTFHQVEEEAGVIPFRSWMKSSPKSFFLLMVSTHPLTAGLCGESKILLPGKKRTIYHSRKEPGKM